MRSPLFAGPASLRVPGERLAFWLTLFFAFPAAAALGYFIHEEVGASQVALFIVIAMVYVTLARGRLLGSSVRVHESQHPRIFAIVKRTCAALEIPMPLVFVREDQFVPIAALGFGEPYALVISSHWIELFKDDELAFVIGRELGHIASGHTRYLSLLSVNGKENPIISIIFGAWLRRCDLSCDRIGLLVCGSIDASARAIAVSAFHHFGREIDMDQFSEQGVEIRNDAVLRWGEWLGSEPYATKRISRMRQFMASNSFEIAEQWFLREVDAEPPALPAPGTSRVVKADCAGRWRRLAAFMLDAVIVLALIGSFSGSFVHLSQSGHSKSYGFLLNRLQEIFYPAVLTAYLALLVGLAGQSFGMMVTGLRVVTTDYQRIALGRAILRYLIAAFLSPFIIVAGFFSRVQLHDKITGTRVVTTERVMARVLARRA